MVNNMDVEYMERDRKTAKNTRQDTLKMQQVGNNPIHSP